MLVRKIVSKSLEKPNHLLTKMPKSEFPKSLILLEYSIKLIVAFAWSWMPPKIYREVKTRVSLTGFPEEFLRATYIFRFLSPQRREILSNFIYDIILWVKTWKLKIFTNIYFSKKLRFWSRF